MGFQFGIFHGLELLFILVHNLLTDCSSCLYSLASSAWVLGSSQRFLRIFLLFVPEHSFSGFQLFFFLFSNNSQPLLVAGVGLVVQTASIGLVCSIWPIGYWASVASHWFLSSFIFFAGHELSFEFHTLINSLFPEQIVEIPLIFVDQLFMVGQYFYDRWIMNTGLVVCW